MVAQRESGQPRECCLEMVHRRRALALLIGKAAAMLEAER